MQDRPSLDFAGVFFTMAIKVGGSEIIHLDWSDHPDTYAWVILVGEGWLNGELCIPQLGRKIPTAPGQIIAFMSRKLAHFTGPHKGFRLVFTCFTDCWVMNHACHVTVVP